MASIADPAAVPQPSPLSALAQRILRLLRDGTTSVPDDPIHIRECTDPAFASIIYYYGPDYRSQSVPLPTLRRLVRLGLVECYREVARERHVGPVRVPYQERHYRLTDAGRQAVPHE